MPSTSTTGKTVKMCQELGWTADSVESYNAHSGRRRDLFGLFDIVAVVPDRGGTTFLQVTSHFSTSHALTRIRKIVANLVTKPILMLGNHIEVWSWCQVKVKDEGSYTDIRRWNVFLGDLEELKAVEVGSYNTLWNEHQETLSCLA